MNTLVKYKKIKVDGITDATLTDIETAWPQDMWELRAELLGKSPHPYLKLSLHF